MEAKDTVMTEKQIANIPVDENGEPMVIRAKDFRHEYKWVAQAQAEISFKAGEREMLNKICQALRVIEWQAQADESIKSLSKLSPKEWDRTHPPDFGDDPRDF